MKPQNMSNWFDTSNGADTVAFVVLVAYSLLGVVCLVAVLARWGPLYTAVASRGRPESDDEEASAHEPKGLLAKLGIGQARGAMSLSKLQMFIWTFVIIFAWLYQLVKEGEFPELPNQALLLMGISGAAYLGAKQQGVRSARAEQAQTEGKSRPV